MFVKLVRLGVEVDGNDGCGDWCDGCCAGSQRCLRDGKS